MALLLPRCLCLSALAFTAAAVASSSSSAAAAVTVTVDGAPAVLGAFAFPSAHRAIVLGNGLFTATFDRDDAASGWPGVSVSLTSLVVGGVELARSLDGAAGDRDRRHSLYIDAGGGTSRLVCSSVRVLRLGADLAEIAFVDNSSTPLQHAHHVIVRAGVAGIYGFDVVTATEATTLSAVRLVARFDRSVLDHAFSDERGLGQQPTSAFLALMPPAGAPAQQAWTVNGSNAPALPVPGSNGGGLPAGYVYSDLSHAVVYAESALFGHVGNGRGAFLVPLSGASGNYSAAGIGRGPHVQGLGPRRDAVIEHAFVPSAAFSAGPGGLNVAAGSSSLFGPWLTLFASGADAVSVVADARAVALAEISASRGGLAWMQHELYAPPANRSSVVGFVELNDGRAYKRYTALLSRGALPPDGRDVYALTGPTYWALSDLSGKFVIPGVPAGDDYNLFVFAAAPPPPLPVPAQYESPSVTDVFVQPGVGVLGGGGETILGSLGFTPSDSDSVRIWRVGFVDGSGGEFFLGNHSREFALGDSVPANLTFACDTFNSADGVIAGTLGQDPDRKWPYAMTHVGGTFLLQFQGGHTFHGNISLKIATSMATAGASVAAAINGVAFAGDLLPAPGDDDPLAQEAIQGARAQLSVLAADAAVIVPGLNNVTLTLRAGAFGFDCLIFMVSPHQ